MKDKYKFGADQVCVKCERAITFFPADGKDRMSRPCICDECGKKIKALMEKMGKAQYWTEIKMENPKMNKLISIIFIITLAFLCMDTINEYRGDFYIRQAEFSVKKTMPMKITAQDGTEAIVNMPYPWKLTERLVMRGVSYVSDKPILMDKAGVIYLDEYRRTKNPHVYSIGKKFLSMSHHQNPFQTYNLAHIIALEVLAGKRTEEYALSAAKALIKLDGNNPTIREFIGYK